MKWFERRIERRIDLTHTNGHLISTFAADLEIV